MPPFLFWFTDFIAAKRRRRRKKAKSFSPLRLLCFFAADSLAAAVRVLVY
jgi:hypothetical protein